MTVEGSSAPGSGGSSTLVDNDETGITRSPLGLTRGGTVDRYVVLDELGAGGMGLVYAAYDPELDRKVAIKILHPSERTGRPRKRDRFRMLREAQAMARLTHPNVVAVFDAGMFEDRIFVTMQLVEGPTLREWLTADRRPWRAILGIFAQAGRGLAAAHAAGLVHRDFKPDNVLVEHDQTARVTDFGLARSATLDSDGDAAPPSEREFTGSGVLGRALTEDGARLGTPAYMSPEQHRGRMVDAASDQFSFCVSLYEALFGVHPFRGDDLHGLIAAVIVGTPDPPPKDSPVPPKVRRAILRGLSADPRLRWPNMEELIGVLAQVPRHRRRWTVIAGAGALVGTGAMLASVWVSTPPDPCAHAGDPIAAVWSSDSRDAVSQLAPADRAAPQVPVSAISDAIDDYAQTWRDQAYAACSATARGDQSGELLDLRMQCLGRRAIELRVVLDLLTEEQSLRHASAALDSLVPVIECDDHERLADIVPRPDDPKLRRRIDAVERRLARLQLGTQVGSTSEGKALAQTLQTDAIAIGYAPLVAEVSSLYATILTRLGEYDAAEREYQRALQAAVRGGATRIEETAWIDLTTLVGFYQNNLERARTVATMAELAVERAGSRTVAHGRLDVAMGVVLARHGKLEEARTRYEAAISAVQGTEVEAATLNNYGILLRTMGKREEARRMLERAVELHLANEASAPQQVAETEQNLADLYQSIGDLDHAVPVYQRALATLERIDGPDAPSVGRLRNNLASALALEGRFAEAEAEAMRAIEIADHTEDDLLKIAARLAIGGIALERGALGQAARELVGPHQALIKLFGAEHPEVLLVETSLCELERLQGRTEAARARTMRVLEGLTRELGLDHPDLGPALITAGKIEIDAGAYAAAIEPLERAVTLFERTPAPAIYRGRARFALALALTGSKPNPPARARALMESAIADFDQAQSIGRAERAAVTSRLALAEARER